MRCGQHAGWSTLRAGYRVAAQAETLRGLGQIEQQGLGNHRTAPLKNLHRETLFGSGQQQQSQRSRRGLTLGCQVSKQEAGTPGGLRSLLQTTQVFWAGTVLG